MKPPGVRPPKSCAPAGAQDRSPDNSIRRRYYGFNCVLAKIWSGGLPGRGACLAIFVPVVSPPANILAVWAHVPCAGMPKCPVPDNNFDFETASKPCPYNLSRQRVFRDVPGRRAPSGAGKSSSLDACFGLTSAVDSGEQSGWCNPLRPPYPIC